MVTGYFALLDSIFAPLLILPKPVSLLIFSALVVFIITIFNKLMVNQKKMKELKERQQEMQKEAKRIQKEDPEKATKLINEVLGQSNKIMMANMKAMIPTMLFVLVFLPWVAAIFPGTIVSLPFSLPYFGNDFGWLMWYFVASIPFSVLFRKVLGVA